MHTASSSTARQARFGQSFKSRARSRVCHFSMCKIPIRRNDLFLFVYFVFFFFGWSHPRQPYSNEWSFVRSPRATMRIDSHKRWEKLLYHIVRCAEGLIAWPAGKTELRACTYHCSGREYGIGRPVNTCAQFGDGPARHQ